MTLIAFITALLKILANPLFAGKLAVFLLKLLNTLGY